MTETPGALIPRVSLVIPVCNEEESLAELLDELVRVLEEETLRFEIIFVDDGSRDRSRALLRGFARKDARIRVICFRENCGQSAALAAGFRMAGGEVVVTMDADLQINPRDIPLVLDKIAAYDVVCGWRARRQDPLIKRASSWCANAVRNRLTDEQIADVGCSLKAFRREALKSLCYFNGMHRFFPTLLKMEGFSVTEVKVRHRPRKYGSTKYGIGNRAWRGLIDLLGVRWMKHRHLRYDIEETING